MVVGISLLSHTRDQFTGTGLYTRELLRGLDARSGEVHTEVLCNVDTAAQIGVFSGASIRMTQVDSAWGRGGRAGRIARLCATMIPLRREHPFELDPEVVHYPLTLAFPPVAGPTVVTLHDVLHRDHPEYFSRTERLWRAFAYDRASAHATMLVTDSEHARAKIVEMLGVPEERVVAIPFGVDHAHYHALRSGTAELSLAGFALPERFLFYPASLWLHKNHPRLFEVLSRLADPDLHLVLSGATFDRLDEVMADARRIGVAERVRHVGHIPHELLPAVYRAAQGLVFPSLYEGFGAPPLEAMACGVPVASSHVASLAEVCGDAALELDPLDVDQMTDAVGRLITDERLRADLRTRGFRQAARFSWDRSVESHLAVYRRTIGLAA